MGGLNNDHPPPTRPRRYLENGSARAPAVDGFRSLSSLEQILRFVFQVLFKYPSPFPEYLLFHVAVSFSTRFHATTLRNELEFPTSVFFLRSTFLFIAGRAVYLERERDRETGSCFPFQFIDLLELNSKPLDVFERKARVNWQRRSSSSLLSRVRARRTSLLIVGGPSSSGATILN